ncbi:MAG: hypothetical protein ACYTEZ_11615 [Planctomycetota bacterium]|jgi:hypothetical protein
MKRFVVVLLLGGLLSPALAGPQSKSRKPSKATQAKSIANVLQTQRISLEAEKWSLDRFIRFIRLSTGLNIVVNKGRIEKDGGDPDAIEITLKVQNVKVIDAFTLALQGHELAFKVKGNVLLVTSRKDALGKPVLRIYSVAHLLVPLRDFPAPDFNVYPSGYEPPEPPEPEVVQTYESSEELAELVRTFTGQGTWEHEGVNITVFRRHLFIRTYPGVHREIARFLARLPR